MLKLRSPNRQIDLGLKLEPMTRADPHRSGFLFFDVMMLKCMFRYTSSSPP
jgi:hypothetical protein